MRSIRLMNPVLRAIGVIGVVAGLTTAVTFAALNDKAVLADTSLSTPTANLTLFNAETQGFAAQVPGFKIQNLIPGQGSGEKAFYLKNGGDLDMDISAHVPNAPAPPAGGFGFSGWDNLTIVFKNKNTGDTVNTNMAELLAGEVQLPGNPLHAGATGDPNTADAEGNYTVTFDIKPEAVTGSHAGTGDFNIVFTGMQHEATATP
jgi:hypothetical protein